MGDKDQNRTRDPQARKKCDLARQRKIAANGSDKAARRHARTNSAAIAKMLNETLARLAVRTKIKG